MQNFKQFLDYVMSFYGDDDALYPIDNLTREEVALATLNYLDLVASSMEQSTGVMGTLWIVKESETLLLTQERPNLSCQCSLKQLAHTLYTPFTYRL